MLGFANVTELILSGLQGLQRVSGLGVLTTLDLTGCSSVAEVSNIASVDTLMLHGCGALMNLHSIGTVHSASLSDCASLIDVFSVVLRTDVSALSICYEPSLSGCGNVAEVLRFANATELILSRYKGLQRVSGLGSLTQLDLTQAHWQFVTGRDLRHQVRRHTRARRLRCPPRPPRDRRRPQRELEGLFGSGKRLGVFWVPHQHGSVWINSCCHLRADHQVLTQGPRNPGTG